MALSKKPRKPRAKTTKKLAPVKELVAPPTPDLEIDLPPRAIAQIVARDAKIKELDTQINAERIARHSLLSGIVMVNETLNDEETVFNCPAGQTKISVFKKSTLEEYKQKASASQ